MRTILILVAATLFSCDLRYTNWPHFPEEIPLNARIRVGEESDVLANLFTTENALKSRVWLSSAGIWTFVEVEYIFDDNLDTIAQETSELQFHALGQAGIALPLPPGIHIDDLPEFQVEMGGEESVNDGITRTARFVPSADPQMLAIRHTTQEFDRLLRLLPGTSTWVEDFLPLEVRELAIRTVGPTIALVEMGSSRSGIIQNGELVEASVLLQAFGPTTDTAYWFGPFDGTDLRMYWSERAEVLCTGVINTTTRQGHADGCLNLGTPHAGVVQASGSVQDAVAVVLEKDFSGNTRSIMTRAYAGEFKILGMGGYTGYRFGVEPTVFTGTPARPTNTESECTLDADLYSVSRFFQTDGTFGFNRCPTQIPTDICECSRSQDLKECGCTTRTLKPQWIFRTGVYTHTLVGWEKVDSRLILRAFAHETDRENRSTLDPTDELKEYQGAFGYQREIPILAPAPGYPAEPGELSDLTDCSTLVGPNGVVPRNTNSTFTVDVREAYTVSLDCTPNDGGPPLEPFVADFDWSGVTSRGFRFPDLVFARGSGIDVPIGATAVVHPVLPWMVVSSGTKHVRVALAAGVLDVLDLPDSSGIPTFLSHGQARFEDGRVIDLESGLVLGNLPNGRRAVDHRFWFGDDRTIWKIEPGSAPMMLANSAGNVLAASVGGAYVASDNTGVWAHDSQGFSAQLYSGSPGLIRRAGISDDGKYAALEEIRLGNEPPRVHVFARDDAAPELEYQEVYVCQNCENLGFVPGTGEVIYYAEQGRLESYNPEIGSVSVLYTGFGKFLPGGGLIQDYFGRFWWIINTDLLAYDPASGTILTHPINVPGGNLGLATFVVEYERFEGYQLGLQVFGIDEMGLSVVFQEQADTSQLINPLAGNRGYRQGFFGERNADSTAIINPIEMNRGGQSQQVLRVPRDRNVPCLLIQQGPFPGYLRSTHSNYVCAR